MIVGLEIPAAPNPVIKPTLVTIADTAPKLTVGSLKAIMCAPNRANSGDRCGTA
jgi:hypothetical protein